MTLKSIICHYIPFFSSKTSTIIHLSVCYWSPRLKERYENVAGESVRILLLTKVIYYSACLVYLYLPVGLIEITASTTNVRNEALIFMTMINGLRLQASCEGTDTLIHCRRVAENRTGDLHVAGVKCKMSKA